MKMCTLPLLAGDNVSSRFVVPTVASAVDIVIHQALERDGVRRVREIVAVPGRTEADVIEVADLFGHVGVAEVDRRVGQVDHQLGRVLGVREHRPQISGSIVHVTSGPGTRPGAGDSGAPELSLTP